MGLAREQGSTEDLKKLPRKTKKKKRAFQNIVSTIEGLPTRWLYKLLYMPGRVVLIYSLNNACALRMHVMPEGARDT